MINADLEQKIQTTISFIQSISPAIRVEYTDVIYQDEHANLDIYPPLTWDEEQCLDFQEQIGEYALDILMETSYLIQVYVYMPSQQIAKAQHELALAQRQQAKANQFLAQATALGIA